LHSSNNPASLTSRLGATIDVEQNHVRFLGDLILNLWDCGGQDAFMDSYLSTQRSTIFQHVGVLIYVFEVEVSAHDAVKDAAYYRDCLDALQKYSPEAAVFLLVHKMDLVAGDKAAMLERRKRELQAESGTVAITVFGTSIHDESLYKVCRQHKHILNSSSTVCVSELMGSGMVTHRALYHTECGRPIKTPDDFRPSVQRYRGHPIRTNDLPRYRHLFST
jgi:Ras-related GTP-binding protein A/B